MTTDTEKTPFPTKNSGIPASQKTKSGKANTLFSNGLNNPPTFPLHFMNNIVFMCYICILYVCVIYTLYIYRGRKSGKSGKNDANCLICNDLLKALVKWETASAVGV